MAPPPLKRLVALQQSRLQEIRLSHDRLKEKERSALNTNIVSSRLEALDFLWNAARTTHEEIVSREDTDECQYISDKFFAQLQTSYEDMLDFLLSRQGELDANRPSDAVTRTMNDSSFSEFELRAAKLPKLDLPTFSGYDEDWENFCDLFTTLVHNAPRIADATKLQYLKSCLKGTAADLVKGVATTNANYPTTWQALKARFHNPRLIVFNHLRALMDIPHLKKESAVDLRSFADEAQRIVRALKNLKMPVEHWDVWFVFVLTARLNPETRKAWEAKLRQKDRDIVSNPNSDLSDENSLSRFPKFKEFIGFVEDCALTLRMAASDDKANKKPNIPTKPGQNPRRVLHASALTNSSDDKLKCPSCSGPRRLLRCYKFKAKTPYERRGEVRRLQRCFNCFGPHRAAECTSTFRCTHCKDKHHSLIHLNASNDFQSGRISSNDPNNLRDEKPKVTPAVKILTASLAPNRHSVILATAQLTLTGERGESTRVRALLDQGSEASFVSSAIANLLGLKTERVKVPLNGLGNSTAGVARLATRLMGCSLVDPDVTFEANAFVLPRLTSHLPTRRYLEVDLDLFCDLPLADPSFNVPDSVDVILGADVYGLLLRSGLRRLPSSSLVAQNTALGWIISGPVQDDGSGRAVARDQSSVRILHCASDLEIDASLQQFWKLEEIPHAPKSFTAEEDACETLFRDTHTRDINGRFVVRLPFRGKLPEAAAETRRMALDSLARSHRRFARDSRLAIAYREFMDTYERLGHMERVPATEINNHGAWYLPHHAVVQSTPLKWKLRVVFDASRKTQQKQSLNDFLMPGPALQRDLSLILLNWRRYRFAFTADIVKMFRQIRVASDDQDVQRIVWSATPSEPPVDYRLTTVTYGTGCAPYLAIRTLLQIAKDEGSRYPLGAGCIENNTYVDDIFAGADELASAIRVRSELVEMLGTAGINLDKWAANHPALLPAEISSCSSGEIKAGHVDDLVKTLGVTWDPGQDIFKFTTLPLEDLAGVTTKRAVLSNISRLFDPLGWVAPVTVTAKILMQDLWLAKCEWDAPIPSDARERWMEYCNSLSDLSTLSIRRWLGLASGSSYQIHGFADASRRAYASAVYIRVDKGSGVFHTILLAAKSKVAPVKTVSIPNLELCAAAQLVKLIGHVSRLEIFKSMPVHAWSDSQIVLNWLRKHPCHWKTFVANRVSLIQTELPTATWAHVPTKENPADLATRGCKPSDLQHANLWWHGPEWLAMPEEHWPKAAPVPQVLHTRTASDEPEILTRFSSLTRLIRVVARCLRPLNARRRRQNGLDALPSFLTAQELAKSRVVLIQLAQANAFSDEIKLLQTNRPLPKRSPLLALNPMLDPATGLLRVGGRLSNSSLPDEQKHPPILPRDSALSRLFVRFAHRSCLHGGNTLTSNTLIQHVWVLGRNRLVKTECRNCTVCQRIKPRLAHQMMGDLPTPRVTAARPFSSSGLDYAGPFQIRATAGRGYKSFKGYIALFVCFATRAVHLEAVGDLTAQKFLSAYKRFVGRRGTCRNLYSDNATTFQSADKQLKSMFKDASEFYKNASEALANDGTTWTFIPPNSPHYGGLWEAGVRSVKHHLKRTFGDKTLTFEEFSTVLVEIEACLNSRPLRPLNSEIDDLQALTPSHFLLGETSGLVPDTAPPDVPEARLDRFHLMQAIRNQFWNRWSSEYMQHLQERSKWREPTENFAVGQLVLVRDDRYPPSKWPLARILETHPGPDGLVRVVTIKTASTTLRRHIARLCPLSLDQGKAASTPESAPPRND